MPAEKPTTDTMPAVKPTTTDAMPAEKPTTDTMPAVKPTTIDTGLVTVSLSCTCYGRGGAGLN